MPFPTDLDHTLVGARRNHPLTVARILYDANRQRCAAHGIHEGDQVTCMHVGGHEALLDVWGRGIVALPLGLAACIEVEPASPALPDRPTAVERPPRLRPRERPLAYTTSASP
jgi:hypothetical protein